MDKKAPDGNWPAIADVKAGAIKDEVDWLMEMIENRDLTLTVSAMVLICYSLSTGRTIETPQEAQEVLNGFTIWVTGGGVVH